MERIKEAVREGRLADAWHAWTLLPDQSASTEYWFLGAQIKARQHEWYGAAQLIERAAALLTEPVGDLHARVWMDRGLIYQMTGDTHMAQDSYDLLLTHRDGISANVWAVIQGSLWFNLALIRRQRHDLDGALRFYSLAAECFRAEGLTVHLTKTLHNQAFIYLLKKDAAGAERMLAEVPPIRDNPLMQVHQEIYQAHMDLLYDDPGGALEQLAQSCSRLDEMGDAPEVWTARALAAWVTSQVGLYENRYQDALRFAELAAAAAARGTNPLLMNLACTARRDALDGLQAAG